MRRYLQNFLNPFYQFEKDLLCKNKQDVIEEPVNDEVVENNASESKDEVLESK